MRLRLLSASLGVLLLSACAGAPAHVVDPVRHMADTSRLDAPVAIPQPKAPEVNQATADLRALVLRALQDSPVIRQALLGVDGGAYRYAAARAAFAPVLDLGIGGGIGDQGGQTEIGGRGNAGLTAGWTIYDGGRREAVAERAALDRLAATDSLAERLEIVSGDTISAAADVIVQQEVGRIAAANLVEHQRIMRIVRDRIAAEQASPLDADEVASRIELAEQRVIAARAGEERARATFRRLAGFDLPDTALGDAPAVPSAEVALEKVDQHPRLRAEEARLQAAIQRVIALDAEGDGSVRLAAGPLGWAKIAFVGADPFSIASALVQIAAPLLDGGRIDAETRAAIVDVRVQAERVREIRRAIEADIETLDADLRAAKDQAASVSRQADIADRVAAGYLDQYQQGTRQILDVLTATNEGFVARARDVASAYAVTATSYAFLARAGGLTAALDLVDHVPVDLRAGNPFMPADLVPDAEPAQTAAAVE